jgi:hypothetical protein
VHRGKSKRGIDAIKERIEKIKASVRAKVEHLFRVIKRQFVHVKVRYRGATNSGAVQTAPSSNSPTKIYMVAADARTAITLALSLGQAHDAAEGRKLMASMLIPRDEQIHLLMDRAYEGNTTRKLALDLGFVPVAPPKSNRLERWQYDREVVQTSERNWTVISPAQRFAKNILSI